MTTYQAPLSRPRRLSRGLWLLPLALALLAALLAAGPELPLPDQAPAAPPVAAVKDMPTTPLLDHAVLSDPARLPEPDPSPLSVAAYGD